MLEAAPGGEAPDLRRGQQDRFPQFENACGEYVMRELDELELVEVTGGLGENDETPDSLNLDTVIVTGSSGSSFGSFGASPTATTRVRAVGQ